MYANFRQLQPIVGMIVANCQHQMAMPTNDNQIYHTIGQQHSRYAYLRVPETAEVTSCAGQ